MRLAEAGFDARRFVSKVYRYLVLRQAVPSALHRLTAWHVPEELDVDAMQVAAR